MTSYDDHNKELKNITTTLQVITTGNMIIEALQERDIMITASIKYIKIVTLTNTMICNADCDKKYRSFQQTC